PNQVVTRHAVASLEYDEALVLSRGSEQAVERLLRRLAWKHEVVATVDDQRRNRHAWGEIDLIHLGPCFLKVQARAHQHTHPQAMLDRRKDRTQTRAPTVSVKGNSAVIDIGTGFQIIEGSAEVLRPLNDAIAVADAGIGKIRSHLVGTLVCSFVDWPQ